MKKIIDGMVNECEYVLDNSCLLVERAKEEGYKEAVFEIMKIVNEHKEVCEALGTTASIEWVLEMLEGLKDGEA